MKVSIITVCYNSAATIEKTLLSVKSQTYNDIEYIVVDGGSTDSTLKLIENYNSIITKCVSESDKGLYDAMNKGIAIATGEIIGILNSDDAFLNNSVLENVVNFHQSNAIDASVGNIIQHNLEEKIVREYSASKWSPEKLKIGFMPAHPAIFFKRALFEKYGAYRLDFKIGADYELITRFFLKENISWKYSGITTTSMLIGGVSSSGYESYKLISKEIKKALELNRIQFSYNKIVLRGLWKLKGFLKKNK